MNVAPFAFVTIVVVEVPTVEVDVDVVLTVAVEISVCTSVELRVLVKTAVSVLKTIMIGVVVSELNLYQHASAPRTMKESDYMMVVVDAVAVDVV